MPHSQPKNWQAELGLKQMLNLGVGRDGQQQDSQCPDAAGGLCVQDSQQRQGNGQDSGGGGGSSSGWEVRYEWAGREKETGLGELSGLQAPAGSLLVTGLWNSGRRSCQIYPLLTLPSTNRPQAWGADIPFPTPQYTVLWSPPSRAAPGTSAAHLGTGVSSP